MTAVSVTRAKRADAVRNRERVLEAAKRLFAERGLDATIPDIAAAAGVGKGTVYRAFESKEHLVAALAREHIVQMAAVYDEAAASPDPVAALEAIVGDLLRSQASNRLLVGVMHAAVQLPELVAAREASLAALDRLLAAGRAAGGLRDDVRADDVRVLLTGVSRVLVERDEQDPAVWERFGVLVLAAIRA